MSRKKTVIAALFLMLVGIGILVYPTLSDYISRRNGSYAIQALGDQVEGLQREKLEEQKRLAQEYNASLAGFSSDGEVPLNYEEILDFGSGIMGHIRIPEIDVHLPIYHGVSDEVLAKGVGHLPETAFPIGGVGNHAVLSSHTGLPGAELFTDLTELETGDMFYITVLEDTLAYQVDQIRVVLPGDVQELLPQEGEDYCTLVTCTPYGINSHRLLVRGVRTEVETEESGTQTQEQVQIDNGIPVILIMAAAAAVCIVGLILFLIFRKTK